MCTSLIPSHSMSYHMHFSDKTIDRENGSKMFIFLDSILTVSFYWVSCWFTAWIPEILCSQVIALGQKQANRSHSLLYLLFALFFFLLSNIFLLPKKMSRPALKYWLVWSPVRRSSWCCCPSAAAQFFFFLNAKNKIIFIFWSKDNISLHQITAAHSTDGQTIAYE